MDDPEQINPDLTDHQKNILFHKETEAPFTGDFLYNKNSGMYVCANCGHALFESGTKFESTAPGLAGWPSFYDVATKGAVTFERDDTLGMERTEVLCANCGGHLGHLFDDPASPNGQHYCINSAALGFTKSEQDKKK